MRVRKPPQWSLQTARGSGGGASTVGSSRARAVLFLVWQEGLCALVGSALPFFCGCLSHRDRGFQDRGSVPPSQVFTRLGYQEPRLLPQWVPACIQTLLGPIPWLHHWREPPTSCSPLGLRDGPEVVICGGWSGDVVEAWARRLGGPHVYRDPLSGKDRPRWAIKGWGWRLGVSTSYVARFWDRPVKN